MAPRCPFHVLLLTLGMVQGVVAASNVHGSSVGAHFLRADSRDASSQLSSKIGLSSSATDWTSLAMGVGIGALVGAAIAGGVVVAMGKRGTADQKEVEEEQKDEDGVEDLVPTVEEPPLPQESDSKATDYQELLKVLAQKVAQEVGPKLSKGNAVRNVLESRMSDFTAKSKSFLFNEMRGTAGAVLSELDAPEAMLILDWDHAVDANFPPASILLAGVLSPSVISLMSAHHLLQMVTVGLPILALCITAIYIDWAAPCSIPTIFEWLYTQTALAALLVLGHGALSLQIFMGKRALAAKTEEVEASKKSSGDAAEMRDEFVGNTMVLQEALLIENGIRHSFWNTIVGIATFGWIVTTIWNLVLVCGWTFVPGVVAMHPKAAEVAKADYCGAWMTILVLKVNMLLAVLYLFLNLATVVQWICDMMIESQGFQSTVLAQARKMDANASGLPVMELLVKSFLLRGGSDTLNSRLAVIQNNKAALQKDRADLEAKLQALGAELTTTSAEEEALKTKAKEEGGAIADHIAKRLDKSADLEEWKKQGSTAIEDAEAKANAVREATTAALEELWEKISQAVNAVQNSETAKALMAKAREAEAYAEAKLHEAMDTLQDPEFQQKLKDAAQQATAQAKELADNAIAAAKDPELQKKLNEAAHNAMEKARAAAEDVAAAANDPEMQKKLQKALDDAKAAAAEAAAGLEDPEMQKKIKEAAKNAMDQAQLAAESAIAAAQDPEVRKKLKEAAEKAQEDALAAAQQVAEAVQKAKADAESATPEMKAKMEEKLQELKQAADKAKDDAKAAASKAAEAAQDPEIQKKVAAAAKKYSADAQAAAKSATGS